MDFIQLLSDARVPTWVRFPNTSFELLVKQLTTVEIERCRKRAQKNGKVDLARMIDAVYRRSVSGVRGMTLAMIEDEFGFDLNGSIIKDDKPIAKDQVITEEEKISDYWLNFIIGLGATSAKFQYWMLDHTGQNVLTEEEEEAEKKT